MKRRSPFLTGFVAAALTFASLMIFAGPQRFNSYGFSRYRFYENDRQSHCRHERQWTNDDSRTEESVPKK